MLEGDDRTAILPPKGHLELSEARGYEYHCKVTLIHDGQGSVTLGPLATLSIRILHRKM
jgi:hypothetical protein